MLEKYLNVQKIAERYHQCFLSAQMSLDTATSLGRDVTKEDVTVIVKLKQQAMAIVRREIMKVTICTSLKIGFLWVSNMR